MKLIKSYLVYYVKKEDLYPRFGIADYPNMIIKIRADLPRSVSDCVFWHELYHLQDPAKNWIWREIKANLYSAKKHPVGFLYTLILSLAPYRIYYYIRRLLSGGKYV